MNTPLRPHTHVDVGQVIEIAANIVINLFAIIGLGTVSIGLWVVVLMQAEVTPSKSPPPPPQSFETFTL